MSENTSKKRPSPDSVIDTTMPSGDDDSCKLAAPATPKFPKVSHEHSLPARVTPGLEHDSVEIADEQVASIPLVTVPNSTGVAGEDAPMVEGGNVVTFLPHTRQHCIHIPFDPADYDFDLLDYKRGTIDKNKDTCPQCYCYVCDKPAGECTSWFSATSGDRLSNHCCANITNAFWRAQREMVKNPSGTKATHSRDYMYHDDYYDNNEDSCDEAWYHNYIAEKLYQVDDDEDDEDMFGAMGMGPNKHIQDNKTVVQNRTIKCQQCANESSYSHTQQNPRYCHKCGRVPDDTILKEKAEKQKQFKIEKGYFLFGRKVFEFTLETPDPRTMDLYSAYWKSVDSTSPQAKLLKGQLEYEAFCLDIGPRPSISDLRRHICASKCPSPRTERQHCSTLTGLSELDSQIFRTLDNLTYDGVRVGVTASWDQTACNGVC